MHEDNDDTITTARVCRLCKGTGTHNESDLINMTVYGMTVGEIAKMKDDLDEILDTIENLMYKLKWEEAKNKAMKVLKKHGR